MEIIKIDDTTFAVKNEQDRVMTYTVTSLLEQYARLDEEQHKFEQRQLPIRQRLDDIVVAARAAGIVIPEE